MRTHSDRQPMGTEANTLPGPVQDPVQDPPPHRVQDSVQDPVQNSNRTLESAASDRDAAREVPGALPSIIIDPTLHEPPPTAAAAAPSHPAPATTSSRPVALDPDSADRFAAAFRPSWEPSVPTAQTRVAARRSLPPSQTHRPTVGAAVMASTRPIEDQLAVPMRVRNRALLWTGGSVVGFLVLAYFGVSSSSRSATSTNGQAASTNHASEPPAAVPMPEPAAQPLAAAEPAPIAAPSAPAPAPEPTPQTAQPSAPVIPAAPTTAWLHVATQPESAELLLDGNPVSNPYSQELPLGTDHQIEAKAAGHATEQRTVRIAAETKLTLVLAEARAAAPILHRAPPASHVRAVVKYSKPVPPPVRPVAAKPKPKRGAGFVADSPY